jgi:prepilin-type N-terminal cleavage/methylation domain-containing protein
MNQGRRKFVGNASCNSAAARGGFTLIECLIAMFLIAIVLPAVELSFAAVTRSADLARHRTEASGLAQSELSSLIASGNWQGSTTLNGDFGPDWKQYTWQAVVSTWAGGNNQITSSSSSIVLEQLDVTVSWGAVNPGGPPSSANSVTVSGLVYQRTTSTTE